MPQLVDHRTGTGVGSRSMHPPRGCIRSRITTVVRTFMPLLGFLLSQTSPKRHPHESAPALPADPATISGETSVSADDAVARNYNGNWVCAIGQANRTDRFRAAQLTRQRPVTQRGSGFDRSECRPNLALKRRASGCDGDRIDRIEIAQEIVADRPPNCRRCGAVLDREVMSFRAVMEPRRRRMRDLKS